MYEENVFLCSFKIALKKMCIPTFKPKIKLEIYKNITRNQDLDFSCFKLITRSEIFHFSTTSYWLESETFCFSTSS